MLTRDSDPISMVYNCSSKQTTQKPPWSVSKCIMMTKYFIVLVSLTVMAVQCSASSISRSSEDRGRPAPDNFQVPPVLNPLVLPKLGSFNK
ncbi:hypothetical protein JTE90_025117 [Oedothorax gibbosus]|uniref:Uncharacterized protein n=1 Tax=Oedothorax gibbosus TaxID=931172 RepID=A0AAV6U2S0_9ARAC|nr:hypothetical protein JTE90_025117 [Oedothorax gibbosus]